MENFKSLIKRYWPALTLAIGPIVAVVAFWADLLSIFGYSNSPENAVSKASFNFYEISKPYLFKGNTNIGSGTLQSASTGNVSGDIVMGDKIMGDKIPPRRLDAPYDDDIRIKAKDAGSMQQPPDPKPIRTVPNNSERSEEKLTKEDYLSFYSLPDKSRVPGDLLQCHEIEINSFDAVKTDIGELENYINANDKYLAITPNHGGSSDTFYLKSCKGRVGQYSYVYISNDGAVILGIRNKSLTILTKEGFTVYKRKFWLSY